LTPVWTKYTGQITIPTVAGKVFGSNGDDSLNLSIGLPLNAIADLSISSVQLVQGTELPNLPTLSVPDQLLRNTETALSPYQTGDYILSLSSNDRKGWLLCDDRTIGSSFSGATHLGNIYLPLFLTLWNSISSLYVPIFTSSGSPTTRGVSAIADFNADKRLALTTTLGRVLGSSGVGAGLFSKSPGEFIGTETVTLVVSNLPPHQHNYNNWTNPENDVAGGFPPGSPTINVQSPTTNGSEHGLASTPFNISQPTLFLNCFIKL
jgi:hypothetical protein